MSERLAPEPDALPSDGAGDFAYEPLADLDAPLLVRLGRYPGEPDLLWEGARTIGRTLTLALVCAIFRIERTGSAPELPRLALVANHASHLDTLAVLVALERRQRARPRVLAARDYFFDRLDRALLASLLGQGVSFDRNDPGELRRWFRVFRAQERGWLLAYPSGSRRSTELHAGLLALLARAGWPIVAVRIEGSAAAWPPGGRPRPGARLRVTFGPPLIGLAEEELVERVRSHLYPEDLA